MHTVFALLCFVVVIHWLIYPYPSGLLHWHCGNLTIATVPAKQPWWIWINTSCEFIMNDCITTTKRSTTKPCAYFLGYTVNAYEGQQHWYKGMVNSPRDCIRCHTVMNHDAKYTLQICPQFVPPEIYNIIFKMMIAISTIYRHRQKYLPALKSTRF